MTGSYHLKTVFIASYLIIPRIKLLFTNCGYIEACKNNCSASSYCIKVLMMFHTMTLSTKHVYMHIMWTDTLH